MNLLPEFQAFMFTAILTIAQCETTVTAHDVKFFYKLSYVVLILGCL